MTEAQNDQGPPEIIIVKLGADRHFVVKGESYLDALMLVDGDFPKPVGYLYFEDMLQATIKIGQDFNPQAYWQVHPEIFARLQAQDVLMELDI